MPTIDKDLVWLLRGRQRKLVFAKLKPEFMANPLRREINKELQKPLSLREMSRHIRDFEQKKLVKCLNPEDPYNKIYQTTGYGKKLKSKITLFGNN